MTYLKVTYEILIEAMKKRDQRDLRPVKGNDRHSLNG